MIHYRRTALVSGEEDLKIRSGILANDPTLEPVQKYADIYEVTKLVGGRIEKYYVPRDTSNLFGSDPGLTFVIDNARVSKYDTTTLSNLSLVGVIRAGQREAVHKSADSLARRCRSDGFKEEHQMLKEKISTLPIIGSICQLMEAGPSFSFSSPNKY